MNKGHAMEKYLSVAWLVATITSWLSFGFASWEWADSYDTGMLTLTILWFVMSVILFLVGLRYRKTS
jgi:hypothetical protein